MAAKRKLKTIPAPAEPAIEAAPEPITSIKGFRSDWTCRGFQFELGKTYTVTGPIEACANGFHACPTDSHPFSVFEYYRPAGARFAEVTQSGASDRNGNKLASATITIGVEISIVDLVARAVKWVWERATLGEGSTATGESGAASATGERGAASATGEHSVALASGINGRAMAAETGAIFLVCRDKYTLQILAVRASKVGENGVKPNVWYSLNSSGEFVEADD